METLVVKTFAAAREAGVNSWSCAAAWPATPACASGSRPRPGGEACDLVIPRPRYCTDNAAMVAAAGDRRYLDGVRAGLDLNAVPTWPLEG